MHEVRDRIEKLASYLEAQAGEAEAKGRLPDQTVSHLREAGVVRLAQPREWGGYQEHPRELLEAVMAVASRCGSSGWVMGVLGVHPWEMALCDASLQREVWGQSPDVWIASPYTPVGRAQPVEGGFVLGGRWPFSSGTDFCDWAFLGGLVMGKGKPVLQHFVLPRADYEIVEGTWDVMGLGGTGSKDLVVKDAFVPAYRTVNVDQLSDGSWARDKGVSDPLYKIPFNCFFGAAIASATIGIAEGVLAAFVDYQRKRINVFGGKEAESIHGMVAIGEASAELEASRMQVLGGIDRLYDELAAGREVSLARRAECRRGQVRAARRAVDAADALFARAGGNAIRSDKPIQRRWRDAHAALGHVMNVPGPVYQAHAAAVLGGPPPAGVLLV